MPDFLESMRRGLERGITSVGAKSREIFEVAELRGQIRVLEEQRRAAIEELGSIAYVMLTRGSLDEARLREKSDAIAVLEARVTECEAQIVATQRRAEEAMRATGPAVTGRCACGTALLEGAKFCGGCGAKVSPPAAGPEGSVEGGAGCPRCGEPVLSGARFCGACGAERRA